MVKSNKYYIKATEVNKAFTIMKKEMLEQLNKFREEIILPLLIKVEDKTSLEGSQ